MKPHQSFREFTAWALQKCDDSATRQKIIDIWAEEVKRRERSDKIESLVIAVVLTVGIGFISALLCISLYMLI